MCIMVTPGYGADVANVEHACHEAYARSAVIAYWRHMATERRHDALQREMAKSQRPLCAHDRILWGATPFRDPLPHALAPEEDAYLGTRDLYMKFEGPAHGWALALLEMLVDPMLKTWVPGWVVEQYERGNPYFKDVLTGLQLRDYRTNRAFLRKVRKEMIWRHQRRLRKKLSEKAAGAEGRVSESSEGGSEGVVVIRTLAQGLIRRRWCQGGIPATRRTGRYHWRCCGILAQATIWRFRGTTSRLMVGGRLLWPSV